MSGVDLDDLRQAASLLKDKRKIIACWAMGLTNKKCGGHHQGRSSTCC